MDSKDAAAVTARLKGEHPFEGVRILQPKTKRDFAWLSVMGFGHQKMAGVGDSQEEAAIAMIEQVLMSAEGMLARAVQYGHAEPRTLRRVQSLVAGFVAELRTLHAQVLQETQRDAILSEELFADPHNPKPIQVSITDDDVGDEFL